MTAASGLPGSPSRAASWRGTKRPSVVDRQVAEYAISLVAATRELERWGLGQLSRFVEFGASPRGSIYLVRSAQALALLRGRGYVLPRDVAELTKDVVRHRLVMAYDALAEGVTADDVLGAVLAAVPQPEIQLAQASGA